MGSGGFHRTRLPASVEWRRVDWAGGGPGRRRGGLPGRGRSDAAAGRGRRGLRPGRRGDRRESGQQGWYKGSNFPKIRAVADAGGARVEGATMGTAWRCGTASHSRSLCLTRRRRRVRQQGASRVSPRPACDAGGHQEKVLCFNMHVTDVNMHVPKLEHGRILQPCGARLGHACYRCQHACYRCEHD